VSACILVVDDEPDLEALIVQKFRRQIRSGEVRFRFAGDGIEALEVLARHRDIDLVLSDINMPRMDGLKLLERLQEGDWQLSTIVVSAYGDMANLRTAMNRGAFDFVMKPIDFADLEATIAKTLRHLENLREARRRQREAERAHASLSRYFSPNLAERIVGDGASLAGERREIATIFTDISGFTDLVETLDPPRVGTLLNAYLAGMTEIVFAHEGTLAKIVGGALHILFGAPADQPDQATRAVACALELDDFAQNFRTQWQGEGTPVGPTRIGLHAGPAIVGNFGGTRFFDYTAYGDTINVAARLETANRAIGTRICASSGIAKLAGNFSGRPVGDLLLKGRREPMRAFEPLSAEQAGARSTIAYMQAFHLLETGDPAALQAFASCVGQWPGDPLANFHLKRLLNGASGTTVTID
jgi:adenylate cyclase